MPSTSETHASFKKPLQKEAGSQVHEYRKGDQELGIFLVATGMFAILGALYSWGEGPLTTSSGGDTYPLLIADLIVTAPLCFLAFYALYKQKSFAIVVNPMLAGVLLYGSIAVYGYILKQYIETNTLVVKLIFPPILGIALAVWLLHWTSCRYNEMKK